MNSSRGMWMSVKRTFSISNRFGCEGILRQKECGKLLGTGRVTNVTAQVKNVRWIIRTRMHHVLYYWHQVKCAAWISIWTNRDLGACRSAYLWMILFCNWRDKCDLRRQKHLYVVTWVLEIRGISSGAVREINNKIRHTN
jgi:hypothetical protein